MLRFVGFAGGLDKQLFRLGFGAIEIERRSRRLHGFLLVAIAVDGLDVLLGLALHFVFDALEVFGRLPIELVGIILVDADVFLRLLSICTARSTALCVLSSYPDCTEEALRARPPQRYGTETAALQRMDETLTLSLCLIFIL